MMTVDLDQGKKPALAALQVLFVVLVGVVVVLLAVYGHLAGRNTVVVIAAGAALTYLGFVSKNFLGDQETWIKKTVDWCWHRLLGSPRRAVVMNLLALGANVAAVFLISTARPERLTVPVTIVRHTPSVLVQDAEAICRVSLQVAGNPPTIGETEADALSLEIPWAPGDANITLDVSQEGFEPEIRAMPLAQATGGVTVELEPRPVLVVSVVSGPAMALRPQDFSVSAWLGGNKEAARKQTLTASAEASFIAGQDEDWFVRIEDRGEQSVHESPAILVHQKVKTYRVELGNDAFPFRPTGRPAIEPVAVSASSEMFDQSVGSTLAPDETGDFLYGGPPTDGPLLVRQRYLNSYNPDLKIPNWVGYRLDPVPDADTTRPSHRADPELAAPEQSQRTDYAGNNYDRGTLVSFADMRRYGQRALDEAAYLSATAPQTPVMNRRTWLAIEKFARQYVHSSNQWICITAGPAFLDARGQQILSRDAGDYVQVARSALVRTAPDGDSAVVKQVSLGTQLRLVEPDQTDGYFRVNGEGFEGWIYRTFVRRKTILTIGPNQVAVPTHFWRVHTRLQDGRVDVQCFLVPNASDVNDQAAEYLVSLEKLESVTGYRFFPELPASGQPNRARVPTRLWALE